VSSIETENRRKSRKAGVPDTVKPNRQRPPALESAVLLRLSEPLSPRRYLALITERQGHSGRSRRPQKPGKKARRNPLCRFSVPLLLTPRLRQCRYIGEAKAHLQHVLTAAAIDVVWISDWWAGRPLAETRCSRFAALQAAA
jgi:hypothetical protein